MSEIFTRELEVLEQRKAILYQDSVDNDVLIKNYTELIDEHHELIKQSIMLTKVSDRLQNKLDKVNDNLNSVNKKLKLTIEQLDNLKISRKANTIVFTFFIIFFIFSEGVIEPIIENWASNTAVDISLSEIIVDSLNNNWAGSLAKAFYISLSIKLILAILIKPAESFAAERMKEKKKKEIIQSSNV
jgi:hypothetical protein